MVGLLRNDRCTRRGRCRRRRRLSGGSRRASAILVAFCFSLRQHVHTTADRSASHIVRPPNVFGDRRRRRWLPSSRSSSSSSSTTYSLPERSESANANKCASSSSSVVVLFVISTRECCAPCVFASFVRTSAAQLCLERVAANVCVFGCVFVCVCVCVRVRVRACFRRHNWIYALWLFVSVRESLLLCPFGSKHTAIFVVWFCVAAHSRRVYVLNTCAN